MASSGKKGKKAKGTVVSLQSFLSNGNNTPIGVTQVAKNVRNIDGDDSDDGGNVHTVVCQLPTAPRASRIFDEDVVPHKGPFIAHITNLHFDINEEDLYEYFNNNHIVSVRLPREDGIGRARGFAYVEFETRNDLIHALSLPDPTLKGRRFRIDMPNEEREHGYGNRGRRGFDSSNSENRESTNWRRDNMQPRRGGDYERRTESSADSTPGSWRMGSRPTGDDGPSERKYAPRDYNRDRDRESRDYPRESRDYPRENREYNRENRSDSAQERPKLNLKPRTLPLASAVPDEKVFGSAKPVDTTARDMEIEQRLAEMRRKEKEVEEATKSVEDLSVEDKAKDPPPAESNWRKPQSSDDDRNTRSDNRSYNNRDDRRRYQDRSERSDYSQRDRQSDGRHKDANNRDRRDYDKPATATQRPTPKSPQQSEPAAVSENKYSGLLDEDGSD